MEFFILISAAIAISIFSFLFGFLLSSFFKFDLYISKKEDYEQKVKTFEDLIENLESQLAEGQKDIPKKEKVYHPADFFPDNLLRDYGLPRSLSEEE